MPRILPLTPEQLRTPSFLFLLREAAGLEDPELMRIINEELPGMTVAGIGDSGIVLGFAAFHSGAGGVVLEYIAVDPAHRGVGLGSRLIQHIRAACIGEELLAETDDDAIDFYRGLGFTIESAPSDARWPDRLRYRCVLPPLSE